MKMCLAPCFGGCTKQAYDGEVKRALSTLDTSGAALLAQFEREREEASEALDFERAALLHKRMEKISDSLRGLPDIARRIDDLDAVILQRACGEKAVAVFPVLAGTIGEPLFLRFGEISSEPRSVEGILRTVLQKNTEPGGRELGGPEIENSEWQARFRLRNATPELPEHLSIVARWFYSNPREGEILFRDGEWPYRRILRACGRILAPPAPGEPPKA
jgi:excinuclease ABC subunit C